MDNDTDSPGDSTTVRNRLTCDDTPDHGDTYADSLWGHIGDGEDGSTWESFQDDGGFPAWL